MDAVGSVLEDSGLSKDETYDIEKRYQYAYYTYPAQKVQAPFI